MARIDQRFLAGRFADEAFAGFGLVAVGFFGVALERGVDRVPAFVEVEPASFTAVRAAAFVAGFGFE